jgi:hypothetical protein
MPMLLFFGSGVVVVFEHIGVVWTHWYYSNILVLFEHIGVVWTHWYYSNILVLFEHIGVGVVLDIGVTNVFEHYYCYFQMMHRFVVLGWCKASPKR